MLYASLSWAEQWNICYWCPSYILVFHVLWGSWLSVMEKWLDSNIICAYHNHDAWKSYIGVAKFNLYLDPLPPLSSAYAMKERQRWDFLCNVPHIHRSLSLDYLYYSMKYLSMMSGKIVYSSLRLPERLMNIFNDIFYAWALSFVLLISASYTFIFITLLL